MSLPAIGTRLSLSSHLGTVAYTGPVAGTSGEWIGVEWDDPSRGKHDGLHKGVQYFTCRVEGAGSFIRPGSGIHYGESFISALVKKYADPSTSTAPETGNEHEEKEETVLLGSSLGLITVQAPNIGKVRQRLAQLDRLREVSLDGEGVSHPGGAQELRERCPNIMSLDVSRNLFPNWEVVLFILDQLDRLESLALNQNRFLLLTCSPKHVRPNVRSLQLNSTLMTWKELLLLSPVFSNLQHLQFGHNRLTSLSLPQLPTFQSLAELNLEGNGLSDFPAILLALSSLLKLEKLLLASNNISSIPHPPTPTPPAPPSLKYLSLASNPLLWPSLPTLALSLPHLPSLRLTSTSLAQGPYRPLVIAQLPSLTQLDGTPLTPSERTDSERFYLAWVVRSEPGKREEERCAEHSRWAELCQKHGLPGGDAKSSLAGRTVSLNLGCLPHPPTGATLPPQGRTAKAKLLPSMSLRSVRLKALKALHMPMKAKVGMYACSRAGRGQREEVWVVFPLMGEEMLERWNSEEGDWVILVPES